MPFRPELRYMYLYIKQHIEATFPGVQCERGDAGDAKTIATLFLPIIVAGPPDLDILLKLKEWIDEKFGV